MYLKRLSCIVVGLLLGMQISALAQSPVAPKNKRAVLVEDPIFGLAFDRAKVHFDSLPLQVRNSCPDFQQGKYLTFAHLRKNSAEYFVVLEVVVPGQDSDVFGVAIEINNSKCHVEDSSKMLSGFIPLGGYHENADKMYFPGSGAKDICDKGPMGACHYLLRSQAEEEVLRGIVQDALARGTHAWGSKAEYKKAVCSSFIVTDANSGYPVVQQELIKFCKQSK